MTGGLYKTVFWRFCLLRLVYFEVTGDNLALIFKEDKNISACPVCGKWGSKLEQK